MHAQRRRTLRGHLHRQRFSQKRDAARTLQARWRRRQLRRWAALTLESFQTLTKTLTQLSSPNPKILNQKVENP